MEISNQSVRSEFDWDDIIVGDLNLDHSENFFAKKRNISIKRHNNCNISGLYPLASDSSPEQHQGSNVKALDMDTDMELNKAIENTCCSTQSPQKINISSVKDEMPNVTCENSNSTELYLENANNVLVKYDKNSDISNVEKTIKLEQPDETMPVPGCSSIAYESANPQDEVLSVVAAGSSLQTAADVKQVQHDEISDKEEDDIRLKLEWTVKEEHNSGCREVFVPRAYNFMDLYRRKREEAQRKRLEEERKARIFLSRPAPNFRMHHKRLEEAKLTHKITLPITPETLKRSHAVLERRKQQNTQKENLSANSNAGFTS